MAIRSLVVMLVALPLGGCGTFHVLATSEPTGDSLFEDACYVTNEGPCSRLSHNYAGAKYDSCFLGMFGAGVPKGVVEEPVAVLQWGPVLLVWTALVAVDLPLSLVADSLILPLTIPRQSERGDRCAENAPA